MKMNPYNKNNDESLNNNLININSQSDNDPIQKSLSSITTSTSSSSKGFNIKNIKRIYSSQIDFDKRKQKYKSLINEDEENIKISQEKVEEKEKTLWLFGIYYHLNSKIDWFFLFIAIIGSFGSGISSPIMSFTTSDVYSEIANTSENRDTEFQIEEMKNIVIRTLNYQIKRQIKFGILTFISFFINIFFWSLVGNRAVYNFKKKYFSLILKQEQGWFDEKNPFLIATTVYSQIEDIEQGIAEKVGVVISLLSQSITGIILAFISSWKLTLVMLSVTPLPLFLSNYLILSMRNGIILSRRTWKRAGGIIEELLYNIKTVASFANFEYELNRFYEKVEIVYRIDLMNAMKLTFLNGLIIFISFCVVFICFIYGRTLVGNEINYIKGRDVNGADIFVAALCMMVGLQVINVIAPNIKGIQESCASSSDYFHLYYRKPLMDYSQSIQRPPPEQIQGNIEFRGVNFSYPSDIDKKLILKNFNINIMSGKKIAIVGESGCGKSTIVNLIERLYDINNGQILIDGIELNKYDIQYLRNYIGYVQQEPVLFNQSIKKNIIFGREEYLTRLGNIDELVKNACDETYASEFINKLEEGLDYVVGIKGSKLSGGQKQRIAIARAIIGNPKLLILDEATSSLDNISEKEVQKSLDNISKNNITTIIIAHRLSSIKSADLIYVIKDGQVIEQGTHEELINKENYYSALLKSQMAQDEMEKQNMTDNNEKENLKQKNIIEKEEEMKFEKMDNAIALSGKDIPIRPCRFFEELRNYKCDIFLGCLGALISGSLWPVSGYFMSKTINALNSKYQTRRYDEGLKYAFIFLAFAFCQGFGQCLMSWKLICLGHNLSRSFRMIRMAKDVSFQES